MCMDSANNRNTKARIDPMNPKHPCVRLGKDGKIHIKPKGATIQFDVESSDPDRDDFYPVGVAFKMLRGAERKLDASPPNKRAAIRKRLTDLNFSQSETGCDGHKLSFTDEFKDNECDDWYEFSVIIQRARDGAIGVIDPDIIHEQ